MQYGRIDCFGVDDMSAQGPVKDLGRCDVLGMRALNIPERFDGFIHEQYGELLRFLRRRTSGPQEAEDVAQDSIFKLLRYRESVPVSDWRRLLYRIAVNSAYDRFRDDRRHLAIAQAVAEDGGEATPSERLPDEFAAHQQRLAWLREAILQLPPKRQRICLLRFSLGMTNAQIARRCGVSIKTVEKHLTKGLEALRRKVGDSVADSFK
jgi:RNA polymerase sigma-70 factor (ECF subfamily)